MPGDSQSIQSKRSFFPMRHCPAMSPTGLGCVQFSADTDSLFDDPVGQLLIRRRDSNAKRFLLP
jgi:hypothetical protein